MEEATEAAAPAILLDLAELAEKTQLPVTWLRRATKEGAIPGLRVGQRVRYSLPAVTRALAEMASNPAKPIGKGAAVAAPRKKAAPVAAVG